MSLSADDNISQASVTDDRSLYSSDRNSLRTRLTHTRAGRERKTSSLSASSRSHSRTPSESSSVVSERNLRRRSQTRANFFDDDWSTDPLIEQIMQGSALQCHWKSMQDTEQVRLDTLTTTTPSATTDTDFGKRLLELLPPYQRKRQHEPVLETNPAYSFLLANAPQQFRFLVQLFHSPCCMDLDHLIDSGLLKEVEQDQDGELALIEAELRNGSEGDTADSSGDDTYYDEVTRSSLQHNVETSTITLYHRAICFPTMQEAQTFMSQYTMRHPYDSGWANLHLHEITRLQELGFSTYQLAYEGCATRTGGVLQRLDEDWKKTYAHARLLNIYTLLEDRSQIRLFNIVGISRSVDGNRINLRADPIARDLEWLLTESAGQLAINSAHGGYMDHSVVSEDELALADAVKNWSTHDPPNLSLLRQPPKYDDIEKQKEDLVKHIDDSIALSDVADLKLGDKITKKGRQIVVDGTICFGDAPTCLTIKKDLPIEEFLGNCGGYLTSTAGPAGRQAQKLVSDLGLPISDLTPYCDLWQVYIVHIEIWIVICLLLRCIYLMDVWILEVESSKLANLLLSGSLGNPFKDDASVNDVDLFFTSINSSKLPKLLPPKGSIKRWYELPLRCFLPIVGDIFLVDIWQPQGPQYFLVTLRLDIYAQFYEPEFAHLFSRLQRLCQLQKRMLMQLAEQYKPRRDKQTMLAFLAIAKSELSRLGLTQAIIEARNKLFAIHTSIRSLQLLAKNSSTRRKLLESIKTATSESSRAEAISEYEEACLVKQEVAQKRLENTYKMSSELGAVRVQQVKELIGQYQDYIARGAPLVGLPPIPAGMTPGTREHAVWLFTRAKDAVLEAAVGGTDSGRIVAASARLQELNSKYRSAYQLLGQLHRIKNNGAQLTGLALLSKILLGTPNLVAYRCPKAQCREVICGDSSSVSHCCRRVLADWKDERKKEASRLKRDFYEEQAKELVRVKGLIELGEIHLPALTATDIDPGSPNFAKLLSSSAEPNKKPEKQRTTVRNYPRHRCKDSCDKIVDLNHPFLIPLEEDLPELDGIDEPTEFPLPNGMTVLATPASSLIHADHMAAFFTEDEIQHLQRTPICVIKGDEQRIEDMLREGREKTKQLSALIQWVLRTRA